MSKRSLSSILLERFVFTASLITACKAVAYIAAPTAVDKNWVFAVVFGTYLLGFVDRHRIPARRAK